MGCNGCDFIQYPPCAIQKIYTSVSLDDIILNQNIKQTMHHVCHLNAQELVDNKLERTNVCDKCGLCYMMCEKTSCCDNYNFQLEKALLKNVNLLNIFTANIKSDCLVATDVKAKGNAREKRVDLVILNKTQVMLIKVLSNMDKYPYYSRSYADIVKYYSDKYTAVKFESTIIIPRSSTEQAEALGIPFTTISMLKDIWE